MGDDPKVLDNGPVAGADVWRYAVPVDLLQQISATLGSRAAFRDGFWVHSMLRLWTLQAFAVAHPGPVLLHTEADVWLALDFPFARLASLDCAVAYPLIDAQTDVASAFLVRDADKLATILKAA